MAAFPTYQLRSIERIPFGFVGSVSPSVEWSRWIGWLLSTLTAEWNGVISAPWEAIEGPWRVRVSTVWRSRKTQVGAHLEQTQVRAWWMALSSGSRRCFWGTCLVFRTSSSIQGPLLSQRRSDLLKQLKYLTVGSCLLSQPRCILTKISAFNFQVYVRERNEMCVILTHFSAVQGGPTQTAFWSHSS